MPPVAAIAGSAGIGAVGNIVGGVMQKNAAQAGAEAQLDAANNRVQQEKELVKQQQAERSRIENRAMEYAQISPGEANSIGRMLTDKTSSLQRSLDSISKQQTILDQLDPAVKAAGKNVYQLLTGQAADALGPVQKERDRQRTAMEQNLAGTLGPGWRTSSAGIAAMTKFDTESTLTYSQVQQDAIQKQTSAFSTLFQQEFGGQSDISAKYGQLSNDQAVQEGKIFSGENTLQNRISTASTAGLYSPVNFGGVSNAYQQQVGVAGGPQYANSLLGQGIAGAFGQVAGAGMTAGMMGGKAPSSDGSFGSMSGSSGGTPAPGGAGGAQTGAIF